MSQTELLDQFIIEARECLEMIGQRLLDVEREPDNRELLNDLFRSVHTLKGNCGLFEFKALERVVHAGEDLLDRVRNGTLAYNDQIADALLEAMDYTSELVDLIAAEGGLPASVDERSQQLAADLRRHLDPQAVAHAHGAAGASSFALAASGDGGGSSSPTPSVSAAASHAMASGAAGAAPAHASAEVAGDDATSWASLTAGHPWISRLNPETLAQGGVALRYRPEAECFFKGEDPWYHALQTPGLSGLCVQALDPWPAAESFDCYACNLDIVLISEAPRAYVEEHFRYVPEQIELVEVAPAKPVVAVPIIDPSVAAIRDRRVAQLWRDQQALLARPGIAAGTVIAVRQVLDHLLGSGTFGAEAAALRGSLHALPDGAGPVAQWAAQHAPAGVQTPSGAHPGQAAAAAGSASSGGGLVAPMEPRRGGGAEGGGSGGGEGQKVLKVAQDKIDRLMDLIGEMVVAKNALPYLAARAETVFGQRELAREIKAQYSVINRIAEDMQHAIMQVRMLPVGTVFQRFGRLVRDISKKLGKDVQLVIEGEDTEADKNVIEPLADPLIHILRNSLDHGIEMPEVRKKNGKPAQGTLKVSARQEGDRVILDISDDGAGIDTDRVRAKAVERGLIPEDRAALLTEHEAVQLVFLPGFSTADAISDLSGRGVGMDVVRSAIERINGTVELSSERGKGTLIRMALPLSMAVTNVMMIEAGGRRFGVPMDLIVETVRVHADDVHHFKSARTTVLRGRIVPLRSLHELLALDADARLNSAGEHAVLVVRMGSENIGLLVDDFHGTSDIILKPLEGVLSGITGFAGTALMGDGSVLMILNPKELV